MLACLAPAKPLQSDQPLGWENRDILSDLEITVALFLGYC